jgi:RPA family protein
MGVDLPFKLTSKLSIYLSSKTNVNQILRIEMIMIIHQEWMNKTMIMVMKISSSLRLTSNNLIIKSKVA